MVYLANAFSLQMLPKGCNATIKVSTIEWYEVPQDIESAIGHENTVKAISALLRRPIELNRTSISLEKPGDIVYVAQVVSGRLPENVENIPPNIEIEFKKVEIIELKTDTIRRMS